MLFVVVSFVIEPLLNKKVINPVPNLLMQSMCHVNWLSRVCIWEPALLFVYMLLHHPADLVIRLLSLRG